MLVIELYLSGHPTLVNGDRLQLDMNIHEQMLTPSHILLQTHFGDIEEQNEELITNARLFEV